MIRRFIALTVSVTLMLVVAACSIDTELGGTRIPNSRPDTRVTGQPPSLLEAGFSVDFNWTGSDPDGRIVGYQWKISDNGTDGISPRDTLTVDPLTGAELHPWRFTTASDTTFLVLADQAGFPGDLDEDGKDPNDEARSFRSHSLFIRAVDDKGAVDPSPALISFTSTTIVPTARVVYPLLNAQSFRQVPTTVTIGWEGVDLDFDLRVPTKVRFLWLPAISEFGGDIRTPYEYDLYSEAILSFDDPAWSDWFPYASLPSDRRTTFEDRTPDRYFLFAIQVQDTAGAVSVGLGYQQEVGHVRTFDSLFFPDVRVADPFLGEVQSSEKSSEIAGGQKLNFSWTASAASYNGTIVSFRHGWDLVDVNDPNDPGWAVPPGLTEQNRFATERSYQDGDHVFTLRVEDDSRQLKTVNWALRVVPFVAPEFQSPLIVIDQVVDDNVQNWEDQSGKPRNDQSFRNPWWHFLADGSGGVDGFRWGEDWVDHTDGVTYADIVKYKVVLCYAQTSDNQRMFSEFRAVRGSDKFVWLTPYQEQGGNFFLVGGSSMESFIENKPNYMVPMVFESQESNLTVNGQSFEVSFGTTELPDETRVVRGPRMYPYATAGIAALDWTSPNTKYIYNRSRVVRYDRTVDCVGLKGLALIDDFRDWHTIGPGIVADTLWTEPEIDWHDLKDIASGTLSLFSQSFPFRNDEFINGNISTRSTVITPQTCNETYVPNGMCVQPMFAGIARFDYIRDHIWFHAKDPDPDWPDSNYTPAELDAGCGPMGLTSYNGVPRHSARTNGKTFGYFSYKKSADKPIVGKADVYWGFDPYRFDHVESRKAIRWVLQYFGLTINQ